MKKTLFFMMIVCASFWVISCASAPAAEPEQNSESIQQSGGLSPEDTNAAFGQVYDTHRNVLILDGAQKYTVEKNDTPSRIAVKFYGRDNGYFFPLIIMASSDVILDPDLIEVGMDLVVPDLQKNLNDKESRDGIKLFLLDIAAVYGKKNTRWAPTTQKELINLAESL
jgi:hypothetical protein